MSSVEKLLKAKIPCAETGIEIKHTMCDICTPGPQCGVDAYVKDGKIIKIEGTECYPTNRGALCTKGASGRQFVYREDRIQYPMKRVGERGEGKFERISWDEAFELVAKGLNEVKAKYGAEGVAFLTGYPKWYRPWLQRFCYSFGSPNYMTESSACHSSGVMSYKIVYGWEMGEDLKGMPDLYVGWANNRMISTYPAGRLLVEYKEKGGKIVIIDTRLTPTAVQMADLYIRPKAGTDAYLANTVAAILIKNDWIDKEFIDEHVFGFEEYKKMVMEYTLDECERITGVPKEQVEQLAEWIGKAGTVLVAPNTGMTHHINGLLSHSAVIALNALKGCVGKKGGLNPMFETFLEMGAGFETHEHEFINETRKEGMPPKVGTARFPLWSELINQAQAMDLTRQIRTADPYPIKAVYGHGVNHMMYPDSQKFLDTIKTLDFVVATDIFMTDFCNYADIVMPACTSYERSEVKCYGGGFINYTSPAIEPLYESKDDVAIMQGVAKALDLDDELLKGGYDKCVKYMFRDVPVDLDEVKAKHLPVQIKIAPPKKYFDLKLETPSGKIELYSNRIAKYEQSHGLKPLPEYVCGADPADPEEYPMTLMAGSRQPNAIHSRIHKLSWPRSLRPDAMVQINPDDADKYGLKQGDELYLVTGTNRIKVKADVTNVSNVGELNMFHGYREANANALVADTSLDPYSGFPGYKQIRCRIEKA